MNFKVFVTRIVPGKGIQLLRDNIANVEVWPENCSCPREVLLQKASEVDGILSQGGDRIDSEVLSNENIKVISQYAVGTDNIDLAFATSRGLPISYTPGVLTEACADHAWALMMAAARRIVESNRFVVANKWKGPDPGLFLGVDVFEQTLGIIGPGRIGQAVAKRASGFSMKVLYYGPHQKPEFEATGAEYRTLDALLAESDFVVLTCPLNAGTKGLIGINQLRLMKKSAILVNIGRGACIVSDDLVTALKEGLIGGVALDVTDPEPMRSDHPLLTFENCLVVPHIGSATNATRGRMGEIAAQGIIDVLAGKRLQFCANPDVYLK